MCSRLRRSHLMYFFKNAFKHPIRLGHVVKNINMFLLLDSGSSEQNQTWNIMMSIVNCRVSCWTTEPTHIRLEFHSHRREWKWNHLSPDISKIDFTTVKRHASGLQHSDKRPIDVLCYKKTLLKDIEKKNLSLA